MKTALIVAAGVFVTAVVVVAGFRMRAASEADVAALRQQVALLNAEVARQREVMAQPSPRDGGVTMDVRRSDTLVAPAAAPTAAEPAAPSPADPIESIGTTFLYEPADPSWSHTAAEQLGAGLTRVLPRGSTILRVECRRTLCEIRSLHENVDAYRKFANAVADPETGLWNGAMASSDSGESNGAFEATTYFTREGHEMPVAARR